MNLDCVERIAEAVLYEGYMLYPYRASAVKNQQRWNFGVLCPRSYSEQQGGSEAWMMQTECLLQAGPSTRLNVEVRFLQIVNRSIGRLAHPVIELPLAEEPEVEMVDHLVVDDRTFMPWQEAIERKVTVEPLRPTGDALHENRLFEFPLGREVEPLIDRDNMIVGFIVRECEKLAGSIDIKIRECSREAIKATIQIRNLTEFQLTNFEKRADALKHSLVSAHTILHAEGGQFVSLLDPPDVFMNLATGCANIGTWPVLVGEDGARDTMLSSPIILYDHPRIAPESPGSLFDGTEIDEILALRILTMTDDEKREMRQSDERARKMLERTESMPPEQFMKLHGAMRDLWPMVQEAE